MAYKIKVKKGRPRVQVKERNILGMTPKGFEFDRQEGHKVYYKRKSKK